MKYIIATILLIPTLSAHALCPEYAYSLFSRAELEANENGIITEQMTLIQKRDWWNASFTNNVLHQYLYNIEKDGEDYALFRYAVVKMGEDLDDDWDAYKSG